jgi:hypothetical protein
MSALSRCTFKHRRSRGRPALAMSQFEPFSVFAWPFSYFAMKANTYMYREEFPASAQLGFHAGHGSTSSLLHVLFHCSFRLNSCNLVRVCFECVCRFSHAENANTCGVRARWKLIRPSGDWCRGSCFCAPNCLSGPANWFYLAKSIGRKFMRVWSENIDCNDVGAIASALSAVATDAFASF